MLTIFNLLAGWCSINPDHCQRVYGIPCNLLVEGDICIPQHSPDFSLTHPQPLPYTPQPQAAPPQSSGPAPSCHSADYVAEAIRRYD